MACCSTMPPRRPDRRAVHRPPMNPAHRRIGLESFSPGSESHPRARSLRRPARQPDRLRRRLRYRPDGPVRGARRRGHRRAADTPRRPATAPRSTARSPPRSPRPRRSPSYHMAPALLDEPGQADVGGTNASARLGPEELPGRRRRRRHRHRPPVARSPGATHRRTSRRASPPRRGDDATPLTTAIIGAVHTPAQIRAAYGLPALPAVGSRDLGGRRRHARRRPDDLPRRRLPRRHGAVRPERVLDEVRPAHLHQRRDRGDRHAAARRRRRPAARSPPVYAHDHRRDDVDRAGLQRHLGARKQARRAMGACDRAARAHRADRDAQLDVQRPSSAPTRWPRKMGPGVVSMSFGSAEAGWAPTVDSYFAGTGMTYVAAAGDSGSQVLWPAVSPNVVAVGGTSLNWSGTGTRYEAAWLNERRRPERLRGPAVVAERRDARRRQRARAPCRPRRRVQRQPVHRRIRRADPAGRRHRLERLRRHQHRRAAMGRRRSPSPTPCAPPTRKATLGDIHALLYKSIAAVPGTYAVVAGRRRRRHQRHLRHLPRRHRLRPGHRLGHAQRRAAAADAERHRHDPTGRDDRGADGAGRLVHRQGRHRAEPVARRDGALGHDHQLRGVRRAQRPGASTPPAR